MIALVQWDRPDPGEAARALVAELDELLDARRALLAEYAQCEAHEAADLEEAIESVEAAIDALGGEIEAARVAAVGGAR